MHHGCVRAEQEFLEVPRSHNKSFHWSVVTTYLYFALVKDWFTLQMLFLTHMHTCRIHETYCAHKYNIQKSPQQAWQWCSDQGEWVLTIIPEEHIICQNSITMVAVLSRAVRSMSTDTCSLILMRLLIGEYKSSASLCLAADILTFQREIMIPL